jgi:alpha-galactosidase
MLIVGKVGWGPKLHPTRLTPNEQYTHISLWCLLCSPLLIGCDMTQLDDFTLNLLSNDEVLEVNQDPLGRQAARIKQDGSLEVWAKDMDDGSKAVGLFNRGAAEAVVSVNWAELGINAPQAASGGAAQNGASRLTTSGQHTGSRRLVRDLWRQKDLGQFKDQFQTPVPRHGVVLVRVAPAQ